MKYQKRKPLKWEVGQEVYVVFRNRDEVEELSGKVIEVNRLRIIVEVSNGRTVVFLKKTRIATSDAIRYQEYEVAPSKEFYEHQMVKKKLWESLVNKFKLLHKGTLIEHVEYSTLKELESLLEHIQKG